MPRVTRMRMYASRSGAAPSIPGAPAPRPSPAARIVSWKRASISVSLSGTPSASMPAELRRRRMCRSKRNGRPLYVRSVSYTPSPYRNPWSKTEIAACSWSDTRPLTFTVAAIGAKVYYRFPMRVLNSAQMREADRRTISEIGIPALVLMENAGRQAVAAMEAMYSDLAERQVAILCGRGNNGGDGFVIARTLLQRLIDVSEFLIGRVADVRGNARTHLAIIVRLG